MYFLLPLLSPLCNLLLVCRPFLATLLCVTDVRTCLCGQTPLFFVWERQADQASWVSPVGLGYSRDKTVEIWQANSNLTFCDIRFFLLFIIILSTFKAVRTVKTIRCF